MPEESAEPEEAGPEAAEVAEGPEPENTGVPEGFVSIVDAERMAAEAYERGRRKAVEVEWGEIAPRPVSEQESSGSQSDIERLFRRRPSVWDMVALDNEAL